MKKTALLFMIVLILLMAASAAHADVLVKNTGISLGQNLNVVHPFDSGGQWLRVGVVNLEVNLQTGEPSFATQGFCIDLKQTASHTWRSYDLNPLEAAPKDNGSDYSPMGTLKANAIRELWGEHIADVSNNDSAAAFQLAVWEIIFENSNTSSTTNAWDLTSGNLSISDSTISSLANSWLGDIGDSSITLETSLVAVTNEQSDSHWQDYVFPLTGGEKPPVPEPITMASMFAALSGLGMYMRKRTVS